MANQQHVDMLTRDGVRKWNLWRDEEEDIRPDLINADLRGADLRGADLLAADLTGADLRGANLTEADLLAADLTRADLTGANLTRADLSEAILTRADLQNAKLCGANLTGTGLAEADLLVADLTGARLNGADLAGADLTEAIVNWANLREAKLHGADLTRADLTRANLIGALLSEANLTRANLTEANLLAADLTGANLTGANLTRADLTGADLSEAICLRTTFSGATLTGCIVYGISAWDVNLDDAKQADLCITPVEQETKVRVDNLEVAQFLYLLLSNQKVRVLLDTITSKVVLILGRFSTERKPILDALREALRSHPNGYIPVLFDFDPQHDKPVLETVKTLANLARFVIADLTDPHMVRAELTAIIPNVPTVPVQPIIQAGEHLPTEYLSWKEYKSFLPVYQYYDLSHLLANLTDAIIAPVEGHVVARRLAYVDSLDAL